MSISTIKCTSLCTYYIYMYNSQGHNTSIEVSGKEANRDTQRLYHHYDITNKLLTVLSGLCTQIMIVISSIFSIIKIATNLSLSDSQLIIQFTLMTSRVSGSLIASEILEQICPQELCDIVERSISIFHLHKITPFTIDQ